MFINESINQFVQNQENETRYKIFSFLAFQKQNQELCDQNYMPCNLYFAINMMKVQIHFSELRL